MPRDRRGRLQRSVWTVRASAQEMKFSRTRLIFRPVVAFLGICLLVSCRVFSPHVPTIGFEDQTIGTDLRVEGGNIFTNGIIVEPGNSVTMDFWVWNASREPVFLVVEPRVLMRVTGARYYSGDVVKPQWFNTDKSRWGPVTLKMLVGGRGSHKPYSFYHFEQQMHCPETNECDAVVLTEFEIGVLVNDHVVWRTMEREIELHIRKRRQLEFPDIVP